MALFAWPFWMVRRARKTAVAAILPHVTRSKERLRGISDRDWMQPYMVGFVIMLITEIAMRQEHDFDAHALALVQCEAWAEITGLEANAIGEEVVLLSMARQKDFELGCRNAAEFAQALSAVSENAEPDALSPPNPETPVQEAASALWVRYFDGYVGGLPPPETLP